MQLCNVAATPISSMALHGRHPSSAGPRQISECSCAEDEMDKWMSCWECKYEYAEPTSLFFWRGQGGGIPFWFQIDGHLVT